ncbi:PQQ-dependent sugar dehydrogenase [Polymorphobacter megasporae]|uniref:PQQ-dependent sugar dehydrogenase n=1 Tax=Glacieibacterium megasporae TaxID=2835787 RepID=UPI001C1DD595|nr:PQQ-dependent sugar dehydrogenase [Polymorphobacter megasporae]UAJ09162.1 PQQ-dependent sugar dehydrogenase [Polymorphobacter megasporae]
MRIALLAVLLATPALAAPVATDPPNNPTYKPAFAGQHRAEEVHTKTPLTVTEVATGLHSPWAIAFMPDGRMLVTEKNPAALRIVTQAGKISMAVAGIPKVNANGQSGLLGLALSPKFATDHVVYWTYSEPRAGGGNGLALARATLVDGPTPRLDGVTVIFRVEPALESNLHNGGRLVFAADGTLFLGLGERSILPGRVQAQDLGSDLGKIVHLNPDGTPAKDNPFIGKAGARPEIWSDGHRNILGIAFDARGKLWEVEMGPRGGDELNLVTRGKDYGWPTIGYGEEYSGKPVGKGITAAPGMEQPVYYWDPIVAPASLMIHSGRMFPEWRGDFFIGGLASTALVRLVVKNDRVVGEERLLTDRAERIRDAVEGPDGAIWIVTDDDNGKLLRVSAKR